MLADSLSLASKNLCQVIYFYAYVRLRLTFSLGPSESLGIFFADRGNTLHIRKQKKLVMRHCVTESVTLLLYYMESLQEDDTKELTCATHLSMIQQKKIC